MMVAAVTAGVAMRAMRRVLALARVMQPDATPVQAVQAVMRVTLLAA